MTARAMHADARTLALAVGREQKRLDRDGGPRRRLSRLIRKLRARTAR